MNTVLTVEEKEALEGRHASERDKYVCDRIKAVLLHSEGWSLTKIAQALRLHRDSIRRHLKEYEEEKKLSPANGGSSGKLDAQQSAALIAHLEMHCYQTVAEICEYVFSIYQIVYTVSGMTAWLKAHEFSYKKPTSLPAKADRKKQQAFVDYYTQLKAKTPENEPILFIDSVHPTMQTKASYGWIRRGKTMPLLTTASRTRINMTGAIHLSSLVVIHQAYETINGDSLINFFNLIKETYPSAPSIHIILDNAGYHNNQFFQKYAKEHGFKLHFLPPYSPNLNPIERLWKLMNETVRNNRYFASPKEFRTTIEGFFKDILPTQRDKLKSRITDNFHLLDAAVTSI